MVLNHQDSYHDTELFIERGYELSLDEISSKLHTSLKEGLTSEEADERKLYMGKNQIITPSPSIWQLYLAPLFDVLITIYLIMTGIMIVLSFIVDDLVSKVAFWLVMIAFNMVLAIFQQFRAQKKIEALQELSPPEATVIRDGQSQVIDAVNLVPGDVIELSLGDRIPADARLIKSSNLTVNESSLTGESIAVRKVTNGQNALDEETPMAKHANMVYLGTFIQTGVGRALVVRTGNYTELGKIAQEMSAMQQIEIPLRKRVNSLGKGLGILMVSFLFVLLLFTYIQRSRSITDFSFETFAFDISQAIINAMSVMPINIPLLTTVILISGVLAMAENKVVIKEISVVETLGRCSVLCSDKTGTMTSSKMTCKLLWDTNEYYQVWPNPNFTNSIAHVKKNEIEHIIDDTMLREGPMKNIPKDSALELLMTSAILNNTANLSPVKDKEGIVELQVVGNATDGALLVLAMTNGLNVDYIRERYKQIQTYPFDSSLKRMSGLYQDTLEDDYMVFVKGATEVVLPLCNRIGNEVNLHDLTKEEKSNILDRVNDFANQGYRVISMAYKPLEEIDDLNQEHDRENIESNLIYIGFAIIYDPPRPGVREAVADLDSAGIFPIMITGDAPTTAGTIAKQVGILDPEELVVQGSKASELPDEEFFKVSVFARVAPKDKEVIVHRYQDRGDVVAMTGDGVNDALAISRSDAGIAMGITGTEVAKEAADIIITNDSYVSIVEGVAEGRSLYNKIRMMIYFYIAVNLAEALVYFSTSFDLDFYILNNWQRVYIFSVVHSFPVLAIIFGPKNKDIMQLKPRDNDSLLPRKLVYSIIVFSLSFGIAMLLAYYTFYNNPSLIFDINRAGISDFIVFKEIGEQSNLSPENLAHAKARTVLLTIIYLVECLFVLSIRNINKDIFSSIKEINAVVISLILSPILLHFSLMYITPLQTSLMDLGFDLQLIPLNPIDLILCFLYAAIPILLLEIYKWYIREKLKEEL